MAIFEEDFEFFEGTKGRGESGGFLRETELSNSCPHIKTAIEGPMVQLGYVSTPVSDGKTLYPGVRPM